MNKQLNEIKDNILFFLYLDTLEMGEIHNENNSVQEALNTNFFSKEISQWLENKDKLPSELVYTFDKFMDDFPNLFLYTRDDKYYIQNFALLSIKHTLGEDVKFVGAGEERLVFKIDFGDIKYAVKIAFNIDSIQSNIKEKELYLKSSPQTRELLPKYYGSCDMGLVTAWEYVEVGVELGVNTYLRNVSKVLRNNKLGVSGIELYGIAHLLINDILFDKFHWLKNSNFYNGDNILKSKFISEGHSPDSIAKLLLNYVKDIIELYKGDPNFQYDKIPQILDELEFTYDQYTHDVNIYFPLFGGVKNTIIADLYFIYVCYIISFLLEDKVIVSIIELHYNHPKGYYRADYHMGNLVLDMDGNVKIIDFAGYYSLK